MRFLAAVFLVVVCISLSACVSGGPVSFYTPVPHLMKLDSKADKFPLPKKAPDMERVENQKNKNIKSSYELDGIDEFKSLDIIKEAKIEKGKIEVVFTAESMKKKDNKDESITESIWQNTLFLLYTIIDTFPEIKDIRLQADYYFLDKYGRPYKEVVFIANTERQVIEKLDRDYFRKEMLEHLINYYLSEDLSVYEKK